MLHPTRDAIVRVHQDLKGDVIETPVLDGSDLLDEVDTAPASISLKLELFQKTGSFKIRGATNVMRSLSQAQLERGVTAFSGGNHAIAVAYAAKTIGTSAKVVMPSSASTVRISACRNLGAEVHLVETREEAPKLASDFERDEGRTLVPPFDSMKTIEGTATLGYEFILQCPELDVILVPIGGGGLAAGVSCAVKQFAPKCKVIGVQPKSADAMFRSFKTGKPEFNEHVDTVADSLCPPQVGAQTFSVCRQFLDDVLVVEETDIRRAMKVYFEKYKLIVEGAGAVSLAGIMGAKEMPWSGKHIGVVISGSNIDLMRFAANAGFKFL